MPIHLELIVLQLLLTLLSSVGSNGVVAEQREKGAKPRRILLHPPVSSFLNSHLLSMERLAELYAENGYEVYLVGMEFLKSRRYASRNINVVTRPLLPAGDNATERAALFQVKDGYFAEKARLVRLMGFIVNRARSECESLLTGGGGADGGGASLLAELRRRELDLVIFDLDCGLILADALRVPKIVFDTAGVSPFYRSFVSVHLAVHPVLALPFSSEMSLLQRTVNVAVYSLMNALMQLVGRRRWTRLYNEQLKSDHADVSESYYNASMMLINTRREFEYPLALMANVLPIGGSYLRPANSSPLAADMAALVNGQQVIYVSFGTHHDLRPSQYAAIMQALSTLRSYRVLWQTRHHFAASSVAEHVRLVSWIDQPTLLSRNETRLFIGHGGLNSALESAYYGVPYLVIPMLLDQFSNCLRVKAHQMGLCVAPSELTATTLIDSIHELMNNPVYRRNAMTLSRGMQFHDVKKDILYWTETIIEHKGWPFLVTPFHRLPWYSYFLIDVVLLSTLLFTLMLSMLILCCCCVKRCCRKARGKAE